MKRTWTVIAKELRTILRSGKAFLALLFILVVSGGALLVFWIGAGASASVLAQRANFSRMMFVVISIAQLCALGLVSPIMTATVVTGERENKTLDLLYCTRLTRGHILAGKWAASIFLQLILVVGLLPIVSLCFQLGGIGLDEFVFSAAMTALTILTYGLIGLACSARFRKTIVALFASLGWVLLLAAGLPLLLIVLQEARLYQLRSPAQMSLATDPLGCLLCAGSPLMTWAWFGEVYFGRSQPGGFPALSLLGDSVFAWHLRIQAALAVLSAILAWNGLRHAEHEKVIVAAKPIDDEAVLRRRRRRFPFYLIDPLRRAQDIQDHQNPLYVKDLRVGGLVKSRTLIRLAYAGMLLSFMTAFASLSGFHHPGMWAYWVAIWTISILLPFIPVIAATGVSREREEKTLDLLLATPLTGRAIIRAKLRVVLRFLGALWLSLLIVPIVFDAIVQLITGVRYGVPQRIGIILRDLYGLLLLTPSMLCFILLFASVCLLCSCVFKRNITAVVVSYIICALLILAPIICIGIDDALGISPLRPSPDSGGWRQATSSFSETVALIGPFLSPYFYYLNGEYGRAYMHAFNAARGGVPEVWQVFVHTAAMLMLCGLIFELAARRLRAYS